MLERATTGVSTGLAILCVAFAPALAGRAEAQTPAGAATPRAGQAAPAADANTTMTVTGCLMKEADYRKAHNIGDNPVNRLGEGDEFVLVDAATAPAGRALSQTPRHHPAAGPTPSVNGAACREAGTGVAYRITGHLEDELKGFVGRRLQVTGRFEHASDAQVAAGQRPASLPPEIDISGYQDVTAAAPAQIAPAQTPTRSTKPESVQARNEPARSAPQDVNRGDLPRTASNRPLIALSGSLMLAAALLLRAARSITI